MEKNLNQNVPLEPSVETPLASSVSRPSLRSWRKVGFLVVGVILAASIFYAGYQFSQRQALLVSVVPGPSPALDEIANWKTYTNEDVNISFKYPNNWKEKPIQIQGSGFTQEFEGLAGRFIFTFMTRGNYNQLTGKPYETIDEVIGMPYKVPTVIIDGQEGRKPLPRAGSENVNTVIFFSKDSKFIYDLSLQIGTESRGDTPSDASLTEIEEGEKIFNQILSTFKFLD